jgi:Sodium/hydrogen exchanger family
VAARWRGRVSAPGDDVRPLVHEATDAFWCHPTDAVAATSVMTRLGAPHRVVTIVEGESLINDGVALTAFGLAIDAMARPFTFGHGVARLAEVVGGGIAYGLVVAVVIGRLRRRVHDPAIQVLVSLITPFIAYIPAEQLDVSGVLATVMTGAYLGTRTEGLIQSASRVAGTLFWQMLTFLLESTLFVLLGLELRRSWVTCPARTRQRGWRARPRRWWPRWPPSGWAGSWWSRRWSGSCPDGCPRSSATRGGSGWSLDGLACAAPSRWPLRSACPQRWRVSPARASGPQMVRALDRVAEIIGSALSRVQLDATVTRRRLTELPSTGRAPTWPCGSVVSTTLPGSRFLPAARNGGQRLGFQRRHAS